MTSYERRHKIVLAVLVEADPMDLAAPDNDLPDEYDAEAREIARRLVHAGGSGDRDSVAAVIDEVFVATFGTTLPPATTRRIAMVIGEQDART